MYAPYVFVQVVSDFAGAPEAADAANDLSDAMKLCDERERLHAIEVLDEDEIYQRAVGASGSAQGHCLVLAAVDALTQR